MHRTRFAPSRRALVATAAGAALVLAGCGDGARTGTAEGDQLDVVASFYPLQYLAERVGGDAVTVSNLTKPGAEPHDVELTPADVGAIADADLVVFLRGLQPAVDEAAGSEAGERAYDVEQDAQLDLAAADGEEPEGASDPHFWLDPTRMADVGDALAERLAAEDEANAATYRSNAEQLRSDLEALDEEMTAGLADCASTDLVTSHTAFAYLAQRYGFEQLGISGLSPEAEPSAQGLAEVTEFVREQSVTTIYYETLVSPDVAQTVADETGATTAVLDPLEGLTDESAGEDYIEVMRVNLETLRQGQSCS